VEPPVDPRPPKPMPIEALKMLADYAKWLAGIATFIIGTSGTFLGGRLSGLWLWPYYCGIMVLVVSVAATGRILIALSHIAQGFEYGSTDPSHFKTNEFLTKQLKQQVWTFSAGLGLFAVAVCGAMLHDLDVSEAAQRAKAQTTASPSPAATPGAQPTPTAGAIQRSR
jgi:hypothetical protein